MKLAIIGSRTATDYDLLLCAMSYYYENGDIECIISGGAKGCDTLAERYADYHNIPKKIFKAEWDKYGKSAGFKRNEDIIREATNVLALWDGTSNGTKNSLEWARKLKKDTVIVYF